MKAEGEHLPVKPNSLDGASLFFVFIIFRWATSAATLVLIFIPINLSSLNKIICGGINACPLFFNFRIILMGKMLFVPAAADKRDRSSLKPRIVWVLADLQRAETVKKICEKMYQQIVFGRVCACCRMPYDFPENNHERHIFKFKLIFLACFPGFRGPGDGIICVRIV